MVLQVKAKTDLRLILWTVLFDCSGSNRRQRSLTVNSWYCQWELLASALISYIYCAGRLSSSHVSKLLIADNSQVILRSLWPLMVNRLQTILCNVVSPTRHVHVVFPRACLTFPSQVCTLGHKKMSFGFAINLGFKQQFEWKLTFWIPPRSTTLSVFRAASL